MFAQGWSDLRHAARVLAKRWRHSALAVLTLALGVGASSAIYSALRPVLLEPLPYPGAERLVTVWEQRRDGGRIEVSFGAYRALAEAAHSLAAVAVAKHWQPVLAGDAPPERLVAQKASRDYFGVLGVAPALGRSFLTAEDLPNGGRVVLISDRLWQRHFHGASDVLSRDLRLDGGDYRIIGVLPAGFSDALAPDAEAWAPLAYDPALPAQGVEWGHHLKLVGRLADGVGIDQAAADLDRVLPRFATANSQALRDYGIPERFLLVGMQDDLTATVRPLLYAVGAAALLLLLIACVNVANLQLARAIEADGEWRVRVALGAGRWQLTRHVLAENLLLAMAGGAAGIALAVAGMDAVRTLAPAELALHAELAINGHTLLFALALSLGCGFVTALLPVAKTLLDERRGALAPTAAHRVIGASHRARRLLVIAEVALALVLLVGAGLLLRSLTALFAIDPGFRVAGLATLQVQTAGHRFDDDATARQYYEQVLANVQAVPGVEAAAWTSQLPLSGELDEYGASFETKGGEPLRGYSAFRYAVSPGYLETMGIALRRGRVIDRGDVRGATPVALISESLAKARFGDADPVGQRLHLGRRDLPWYTVVGVVADVKQATLTAPRAEAVYISSAQWYFVDPAMSLVLRGGADPMALLPAVRAAIWSVDREQAIVRSARMSDLVAASAAERRFALSLFEAFGAVALLLAAIGLFGVLAAAVADRRREIGVRLALGAPAARVTGLVLRQGLFLMLQGIGLGIGAALVATRCLESLLYSVGSTDVVTYVAIVALLLAVALVACWWPARRAAAVDPLTAIRSE